MSNLSRFKFNSSEVRVLTIDGEPWFVAKDVCAILELTNVGKALERLDEDEKRVLARESLDNMITLSDDDHIARLSVISESGLYALALSSRKPEAKPFRKWVTSEVLPSIRKTGSYSVAKTPLEAMVEQSKMLTALLEQAVEHERRLAKVEAENQQMKEILEVVEMEVQANTAELERFRNGHGYYYSIAGYCSKLGQQRPLQWMNNQGRKASAMCRQKGIVPEKVSDPRWGTVNTYPDSVLNELTW
jgi:prophage antirepressor-like protein